MWMLGFAIAAIVAAIALLLRQYVKLSAQEDPPAAAPRDPLRRPLLKVPLKLPSTKRAGLRTGPAPLGEGDQAMTMLIPEIPLASLADRSFDEAADRPVPVLEVVLTGSANEVRPAPVPHEASAPASAATVRFG